MLRERPGRNLRNYLVHLFAPKQHKWPGTSQAEGEELLWTKITGRKARCPVAMEGTQTIISTLVPTNPPSALMWEQNQAAVKRLGTATFGGLDP